MVDIADLDISDELREQVAAVASVGGRVELVGGGSKAFYGETVTDAVPIEVGGHSGVIDYDPAEMVITLRSGCRLEDVNKLLLENNQQFAFEPPAYTAETTIGGMIAAGLCGPRRAFAGNLRDYLLGATIINGRGELLQFGGRVIKNVAGFDLSRVMAGSLGTLGVIVEASIRVIPCFEQEVTLAFEHVDASTHIDWINQLGSLPYPISGSFWQAGRSLIRLSGSVQGNNQARETLGGDLVDFDWTASGLQDFASDSETLVRVALPPATNDVLADAGQVIEWGGAQRWLLGEQSIEDLRTRVGEHGGNVCAFRGYPAASVFQAPAACVLALQKKLKASFDPQGIFNPDRLFRGL